MRPLFAFAVLSSVLVSVGLAGPGPRSPGQYLSPPDSVTLFPFVDLAGDTARQTIVDRDPNCYLGHPTTVLLEDNRTMLCVYPPGHGKGPILLKRSPDAGLTWSDRLPVPDNWSTSLETPTLYRVTDAAGKKRLIVWSGCYPARLSVSEDDGDTWSPLTPVGDWGGIVVMSSLAPVRGQPGRFLAWFNDDGRFLQSHPQRTIPPTFAIYQVASNDGGLTWSSPRAIASSTALHLAEPGFVRSPDGQEIALLLREDSKQNLSQVIFSRDEGATWSAPRPLPLPLLGDRHVAAYAPDGRLVVVFRDSNRGSPTNGDWLAWIGTYADLVDDRPGQYRVRLMHNTFGWDCGYSGLHVLPDGTFVATGYGHWTAGEEPYIVTVRFQLSELDPQVGRTEPPPRSIRTGTLQIL